jgi:hypothetical protein
MIPRIEDSHGLRGPDFIEMSWPRMVHDKEFYERRALSEHGGQTMVIGGMHYQHLLTSRQSTLMGLLVCVLQSLILECVGLVAWRSSLLKS